MCIIILCISEMKNGNSYHQIFLYFLYKMFLKGLTFLCFDNLSLSVSYYQNDIEKCLRSAVVDSENASKK